VRDVLPGSGEAASAANSKLQTVYDYKRDELEFLDVTAGMVPDNRYTDHLPDILQKDDLLSDSRLRLAIVFSSPFLPTTLATHYGVYQVLC